MKHTVSIECSDVESYAILMALVEKDKRYHVLELVFSKHNKTKMQKGIKRFFHPDGEKKKLYASHLKSKSIKKFNTDNVRSWLVSKGFAKTSAGSLISDLKKDGVITIISKGNYEVAK